MSRRRILKTMPTERLYALTREQREMLMWIDCGPTPRGLWWRARSYDIRVAERLCERGLLVESTFGWTITGAGRVALGDDARKYG